MSRFNVRKILLPSTLVIGIGAVIGLGSQGVEKIVGGAKKSDSRVAPLPSLPAEDARGVLFQIHPLQPVQNAPSANPTQPGGAFAAGQASSAGTQKSNSTSTTLQPGTIAGQQHVGAGVGLDQQMEAIAEWEEKGEKPDWLSDSSATWEAVEKYRRHLSKSIDVDFNGVPVRQVLATISKNNGFQIWINHAELDAAGVDLDAPVTVTMKNVTVRNALRLFLGPLDLDFVARENLIEITSIGSDEPQLGYYELSHILPNAANVENVLATIERHIDPDTWLSAGGKNTMTVVGSLLIVTCNERTHERIRSLLGRIGQVPRKNLAGPPPPNFPNAMRNGVGALGSGGMF